MSCRKSFERTGRIFGRISLRGGLLALALAMVPAMVSGQSVEEKYAKAKTRFSKFNLNASPTAVLRVNQYQCGLQNEGATCTDVFDSPTGGGGFWPTGSPNQYMFNSGLQVAGIIPMGTGCTTANKASQNSPTCFAWSGDTTGTFFMDAAGTRQHGTALSNIYDSLNPDDLANWPTAGFNPNFPLATAMVEDTALFNDVLIGRKAASQQDSYVMYWDGDPVKTGGRTHPMGILVEQRTLAWNYPEGNENIIYFLYKFTNVTNNALFQQINEARYFGGADKLPNAGWRFDSIYVAYDSDPDVTPHAGDNYATAVLPFSLGLAYKNTFLETDFVYPPALFRPPFFPNAPGLLGLKYLKSPVDPATGKEVGLTSFSLHTNGGLFPDPSTVARGWRYISLNVDAGKGDPNCTFSPAEVRARKSCYLQQTISDVRMFIGSGPFTLEPGGSATIAVAQFAAATVATPLIVQGTDNKPLFPSTSPGCFGEPIRPIDAAAGYVRVNTCPPAGQLVTQFDVTVVKNSLLGRALVAQSIFDNKFLLGFAPENPLFYLVPGNNKVTVVWEPTATERDGDPFFSAAGDPTNTLYDKNYRQFDVEGYRVYRGTSPANMVPIAQYDKSGTRFTDRLCALDPTYVSGDPCTAVTEYDITGDFVQYTSVAKLANGTPLVLAADTALASNVAAGGDPLSNTGIPFNYIDNDVKNGFQYFYKVTAFDINSIRSGPSSLEAAGVTKSVVPTKGATTLSDPAFTSGLFGRAATALTVTHPTINPATGTFSGPAAPTSGLAGDFAAFAAQLLPKGITEIRIDSVVADRTSGYYPNGGIGKYYVSGGGAQAVLNFSNRTTNAAPGTQEALGLPVVSVQADPAVRQKLIAAGVDAPPAAGSLGGTLTIDRPHWHSASAKWAPNNPGFWQVPPPAGAVAGGSRWFVGANETQAHPALAGFTAAGAPLSPAAGAIPGYVVFKPNPYMTVNTLATYSMFGYGSIDNTLYRRVYGTTLGITRAADVKVFWGAAGVDSVVDVTHNVRVLQKPNLQAAYGFLTDADADGVLTHGDFLYIPGFETTGNILNYSINRPRPLVAQPVVMNTSTDGNLVGDGPGFGLLINGEPYLFGGPLPVNQVWTLRTYNGSVTLTNGVYAFTRTGSNPAIPGLRLAVNVTAAAEIVAANADLAQVHTVPDPYYAVSQFDLSSGTKELQFVNMPAKGTIRIYSLSGVLVDVVNHDSPIGGSIAKWNLRNRSNQFVASGVYLFHVSTPDGKSAVGKFTIINSGFAR